MTSRTPFPFRWAVRACLALAAACLATPAAAAPIVSVNFGTSANNLLPSEEAGLIAAANWNNATTTNVGTLAGLRDNAGAATGVNVAWSGAGLTNNQQLVTGSAVGTPSGRMMGHFWGSNNTTVQQPFFVAPPNVIQNFVRLEPGQSVGNPAFGDNTVRVTNLNALFPNGYDVYVYLAGSGSFPNENAGALPAIPPGGLLQTASPLHVLVGPNGTINWAATRQLGANNNAGSIEDLATAPPGTERALIWPTTLVDDGTVVWSSRFDGTFATSPLAHGARDLIPLDRTLEGAAFAPPTNDTYNLTTGQWVGLPFHDPAARGIPTGNYVLFDNLSFDTLELVARQVQGMRNAANSAALNNTALPSGGITGFQIVGREAGPVAAVPEPASVALLAAGAAGALVVRRRRRC